nr:protein ABIL2-like [Ipomoea trifida]
MGSESPSSFPLNAPTQTSNSEEIFMQHSLHFTESLKELKGLRKQLYSAAEYFEVSYGKDDQKQLVVDSLKDYVSKAVISTVDHLGSVASKLDTFLDEKVDEFSDTKLRFSCIEQKSRSYQEFINRSGLMQQSLFMITPKYRKRYVNPSRDTMCALRKSDENISFEKASIYFQDDIHQSQHKQGHCLTSAFLGATTKALPPLPRKRHSKPSSIETSPNSLAFSFTRAASNKEVGKRSHSPLRFSLKRSGSYANRSTSPTAFNKQRCPSEPRRTVHTSINPAKNSTQDMELLSKKSKHLLKALLSINRSQKGVPSRYQDDR